MGVNLRGKVLGEAAFLVAAATGSLWFTYQMAGRLFQRAYASMDMLMNGSADRPFQFRVLIPWLAGILSTLTEPFLTVSPDSWLRLTDFISVLLLIYAFRRYISLFIPGDGKAKLMALSVLPILTFNYLQYPCYPKHFPYDMPAILLFTVGLILLYQRRWAIYYPFFILATLNKETACFLTVVYLLTEAGKSRPKTIAAHCLAQLFIWVAIKHGLYRLYADNPGAGLFEDQFSHNLYLLSRPQNYPNLLRIFGGTWISVMFFNRRIKDDFVRRSLLVVFPFLFVMLFMGKLDEIRIYGELIPVVFAAFLIIFNEIYEKKLAFLFEFRLS